jgi:hypothetical protein
MRREINPLRGPAEPFFAPMPSAIPQMWLAMAGQSSMNR